MSTTTRLRTMRLFLRLPIRSGHNSSTQASRLVKKSLCRGPCVPGDPGPRPPLVVAGQDLLPRPPAQLHREADVVQGDEPVSQKLVLPHEVCQVRPAVPRTRLARTPWIERSEIPAMPGVPEVDAAVCGQRRPVAGEPGREHAVEHVHPEPDDLEYPDRVPYAHEVPRPVCGEHGRGHGERPQHLFPRLPDREAADGVAGEPYLHRAVQALLAQIRIEAALHDAEQRLIGPPVRRFAPPRPPRRPPQRLLVVLAARVGGRALVQDHRDIRPKALLNLRDQLRCEGVPRAVVDGGELDALLRDPARFRQGEDLVAARVGKHRPVPTGERVKAARLPYEVSAGPQVEVVGVAEHDAGPYGVQLPRRQPLDRTLGPHGHESRRLDRAVRRPQDPGPRLAVACHDLYGDRSPYRPLPPLRISIASPNE